MQYSDIRQQLEQTFNTGWGSTTPIAWENVPKDIENEQWVRFTIITTSAQNRAIGDDSTMKRGFAVLQIFVPLHGGLGAAYTLADTFLGIMQNQSISQIFTYAGTIEHIGESPTTSHNPGGSGQFRELTPGFFQINVKIPFEAY